MHAFQFANVAPHHARGLAGGRHQPVLEASGPPTKARADVAVAVVVSSVEAVATTAAAATSRKANDARRSLRRRMRASHMRQRHGILGPGPSHHMRRPSRPTTSITPSVPPICWMVGATTRASNATSGVARPLYHEAFMRLWPTRDGAEGAACFHDVFAASVEA